MTEIPESIKIRILDLLTLEEGEAKIMTALNLVPKMRIKPLTVPDTRV